MCGELYSISAIGHVILLMVVMISWLYLMNMIYFFFFLERKVCDWLNDKSKRIIFGRETWLEENLSDLYNNSIILNLKIWMQVCINFYNYHNFNIFKFIYFNKNINIIKCIGNIVSFAQSILRD